MTAATPEDDNRARELGQRLLLDWRVRCGVRHAAVAATSNPDAMALCVAVARTLEQGLGVQELALAACTWAAAVPSSAEARSALLCLCDVAAELGTATAGDGRRHTLDLVLEQLSIVAAPAPAPVPFPPARRHDVDALTGCRGRLAFAADLEDHVVLAGATGTDVTVVLAELSEPAGPRAHRKAKSAMAGDVEVLRLVAALRRATGSPRPVYRVGECRFALLLPRTNRLRAGELMLLATCGTGPAFHWGAGSLGAAGRRAADDPGVVMVLAEADLLIRRRDLSRARAMLARRRRASVTTSAAAALALVGGSAFGLDALGGGVPLRAALHAPAHGSPSGPAHRPVSPPHADAPAAPVPAPATPLAAGQVSAPVAPAPAAGASSAAPVALVSVQSPPAPKASTPVPVPTVPTVPTVPRVPTTTVPPDDSPAQQLAAVVKNLLHEAKHAVPWNKGRHGAGTRS